jgi:transposase
MRGGYSSLQAGGGTALPPFNAPARKCQCRAIRSAGKWPRQAAPREAVSEPENTDLVQVRRAYKFRAFPTRALVDQCDVIALEDLNIAGMTRRPAPRPDPGKPGTFVPNRARTKAGLNRSILDAGWAQFTSILTGKAAEAGRRLVLVNPAGTSNNCHRCGRRCERPQRKTVMCPVHGAIDADVNGARNIASRAGLGSGQAPTAA